MNAAILCSGPSLAQTWRGDSYDLIVAVNRAVMVQQPDWWCFIDAQMFIDNRYLCRDAKLCSSKSAEHRIGRTDAHDDFYRRLGRWTDDLTAVPRSIGWTIYSATCAQVLAYELGTRRMEIFGADMTGVTDFDGHTAESDCRTDVRWNNERVIVGNLDTWLLEHGTEVVRIRNGTA